MAAISFNSRVDLQANKNSHGAIVEEIEGLIRVHRDGQVERPPIVPSVHCSATPIHGVTARDITMDKFTSLWARVYVPTASPTTKLPLLVYFHGGGFCVGSPAWSCYHDFLLNLASKAGTIVLSINYRLAPENRLPTAYDDGMRALTWIKQQAVKSCYEHSWWIARCNLAHFFLAGDSAGANIAYNVATRLVGSPTSPEAVLKPLFLKGILLIQPFFGGESRTWSEKCMVQPANSALTISASDTYWRLSLPAGANRDHPWCNPLASGTRKLRELQLPSVMVCISELDVLKDRNMGFCNALTSAGKRVETVICKGVGHAFQVLDHSQISRIRVQEMMAHVKTFIHNPKW